MGREGKSSQAEGPAHAEALRRERALLSHHHLTCLGFPPDWGLLAGGSAAPSRATLSWVTSDSSPRQVSSSENWRGRGVGVGGEWQELRVERSTLRSR